MSREMRATSRGDGEIACPEMRPPHRIWESRPHRGRAPAVQQRRVTTLIERRDECDGIPPERHSPPALTASPTRPARTACQRQMERWRERVRAPINYRTIINRSVLIIKKVKIETET